LNPPTKPTIDVSTCGAISRCAWSGMKQYACTATRLRSASERSRSTQAVVSGGEAKIGRRSSVQVVTA
jgi:hypothetical protein